MTKFLVSLSHIVGDFPTEPSKVFTISECVGRSLFASRVVVKSDVVVGHFMTCRKEKNREIYIYSDCCYF
jgi:hypothetical protein